jgi:hypothetical protein
MYVLMMFLEAWSSSMLMCIDVFRSMIEYVCNKLSSAIVLSHSCPSVWHYCALQPLARCQLCCAWLVVVMNNCELARQPEEAEH